MRIPKYRVYIKHWGDLNDEFVYIKEGELYIYFRNWEQNMYKSAVFQQFTGLLDKNGKEIYEGDIVKLEMCIEKVKDFYKDSKDTLLPIILEKIVDGDYCGVVRFDGDNGILSHFQYYVDLIPFYSLKSLTSNIEVVGNIFDNMIGARMRLDKRLADREKPNLDEVEFGIPHLKED